MRRAAILAASDTIRLAAPNAVSPISPGVCCGRNWAAIPAAPAILVRISAAPISAALNSADSDCCRCCPPLPASSRGSGPPVPLWRLKMPPARPEPMLIPSDTGGALGLSARCALSLMVSMGLTDSTAAVQIFMPGVRTLTET